MANLRNKQWSSLDKPINLLFSKAFAQHQMRSLYAVPFEQECTTHEVVKKKRKKKVMHDIL